MLLFRRTKSIDAKGHKDGYEYDVLHVFPPCYGRYCGTRRKKCRRVPKPRNCPIGPEVVECRKVSG